MSYQNTEGAAEKKRKTELDRDLDIHWVSWSIVPRASQTNKQKNLSIEQNFQIALPKGHGGQWECGQVYTFTPRSVKYHNIIKTAPLKHSERRAGSARWTYRLGKCVCSGCWERLSAPQIIGVSRSSWEKLWLGPMLNDLYTEETLSVFDGSVRSGLRAVLK